MAKKPKGAARAKPAEAPVTDEKPPGRPLTFNQARCDEICARMADGESLREICRTDGMPPESTVRLWATDDRKGFAAQYARAREAQAEYWAEEILEISDDGSNDWMLRQNGEDDPAEVVNHEHIQRSKLRVDSRKWLLSKLLPKRYGDRITQEHTGKDGGPIEHRIDAPAKETREEWLARQMGTPAGAATGGDPGGVVR